MNWYDIHQALSVAEVAGYKVRQVVVYKVQQVPDYKVSLLSSPKRGSLSDLTFYFVQGLTFSQNFLYEGLGVIKIISY